MVRERGDWDEFEVGFFAVGVLTRGDYGDEFGECHGLAVELIPRELEEVRWLDLGKDFASDLGC